MTLEKRTSDTLPSKELYPKRSSVVAFTWFNSRCNFPRLTSLQEIQGWEHARNCHYIERYARCLNWPKESGILPVSWLLVKKSRTCSSCKDLIWYLVLGHDPSRQIFPNKYMKNPYQKGHNFFLFTFPTTSPCQTLPSTKVKPWRTKHVYIRCSVIAHGYQGVPMLIHDGWKHSCRLI